MDTYGESFALVLYRGSLARTPGATRSDPTVVSVETNSMRLNTLFAWI